MKQDMLWAVVVETQDRDRISTIYCTSKEKAEDIAHSIKNDAYFIDSAYYATSKFRITVIETQSPFIS